MPPKATACLAATFLAASHIATPITATEATVAAAETVSAVERWTSNPLEVFDAQDVSLAELQWVARPIIVFANSPLDPAFLEQMEELERFADELVDRDVMIVVDTDPAGASELRQKLRPRGFMLVLIGKDGQVKLRKPLPWTVRELSRSIDKMPLRQREIRDNR